MRLILTRHGETANNAGGVVQGRVDAPLNERGRQQAAALARALAAETPAAVVTSPLERARVTAAAIAESHGLPLTLEPDLMEMDVGEMEGLNGAQMRERFPEFLAVWRGPDGPAATMPGGESLQDVQARAWAVVERLRDTYPEGTVIVTSHNFVISGIICRAIGLPLDRFRRLRFDVASRTVLDMRPDRTLALVVNDTCHLGDAALQSGGRWEGPLKQSASGE